MMHYSNDMHGLTIKDYNYIVEAHCYVYFNRIELFAWQSKIFHLTLDVSVSSSNNINAHYMSINSQDVDDVISR